MIRVLIIDDEALVRAGLRMILESADDITVVGEADDGADAVDAITNHRPYRAARSWRDCRREIVSEKGKQFDPMVVDAFCDREYVLHEIRREFLAAA